jgi:hypothetical protein
MNVTDVRPLNVLTARTPWGINAGPFGFAQESLVEAHELLGRFLVPQGIRRTDTRHSARCWTYARVISVCSRR